MMCGHDSRDTPRERRVWPSPTAPFTYYVESRSRPDRLHLVTTLGLGWCSCALWRLVRRCAHVRRAKEFEAAQPAPTRRKGDVAPGGRVMGTWHVVEYETPSGPVWVLFTPIGHAGLWASTEAEACFLREVAERLNEVDPPWQDTP